MEREVEIDQFIEERANVRAEASERLCPPPNTRRSSSGDPFCVSQTCAKMKPLVLRGTPEDDGYTSFCNRENEIFPHHNEIPNITEHVLNRYSFNTNHDSCYDDYKDPTYDLFLSHLREDEKSYIVEISDLKNGLMTLVKYEKDDPPQLPKTNDASIETKKLKGMPYENNLLDDEKVYARNTTDSPCNVNNKKKGFSRMDESYQMYLEEYLLPNRSKISDVDGLSVGNSAYTPLKSKFKHAIGSPLDDYAYMKFLENVKLENGFMVLESEPGISLKYSVDGIPANNADSIHTHEERFPADSNKKEEKIGSIISQEERVPSLFPSPFKKENLDYVPYGFHFSVQYKNELMEALSKPYDRDEYEQLLKKATERKPMTKDKHLRARSVSYETHEMAPSYLDHYPDLASQIEAAERTHRLTLLRGLFFWLQHRCHNGSFVPWKSYPTSAAPPLNVDCEIVPSLDAHVLQKSVRSRETSGTV